MKSDFIWDTNTVIYYLQHQLTPFAEKRIDAVLEENNPAISVVTEIELLSWRAATSTDISTIKAFIANSDIYQIDTVIKNFTIEVRKNYNLKLPDAMIAATALALDKTLLTRNVSDFNKISGFKVLNPFSE